MAISAWCGHGPDERGPVQVLTRRRSTDEAVAYGTGYRVRNQLVLTAEHVVPRVDDGEPRVTAWRKGQTSAEGRVVWRGADIHVDLALVELDEVETWPPVAGAAWGVVDRESPLGPVRFRFLGYPEANELDEEWNLDDRSGQIPLQTFAEADLFACDVVGAAPTRVQGKTMWGGASGSAVFAEGLLVGVVTDDPVRVEASRLIAVPVHKALADEQFSSLVGVHRAVPVARRPFPDPEGEPIELAAWIDDTTEASWAAGLKQAFEGNGIGFRFLEGELPEAELLRWNRLADPSADRYLSVLTAAGSEQAIQLYEEAKFVLTQRDDLQLAVLAPEEIPLEGIESRHIARHPGGDDVQAIAATVVVQLAAGLHAGRLERPALPKKPAVHRGYTWLGNFVGRHGERRSLSEWLRTDGEALYVLQAMGGTGKSALAWIWLMGDVLGELKGDLVPVIERDEVQPLDGVAWFSFYGSDSTSSTFFTWLLDEFDSAGEHGGDDDPAGRALALLRDRRLVVVMDGLERELRAYLSLAAARLGERVGAADTDYEARSAVNPALTRFLQGLTDPTIDSKVLITTRLLPSELDDPAGILGGFRHTELPGFGPQDVVQLYRGFGIAGTDAEIIAACQPYGFHPLTVRLLAGMIVRSPRDRGHIRAAPRYDPLAVGEQRTRLMADSYDSLLPDEAQVLGRLAACRGGVRFAFAHRISGIESEMDFETALAGLIGRGLVMTEPDASRFDLHPIVRHYAYGRLVDREGLHQAIAEELEEELEDVELDDDEYPLEQFLAHKDDLLEFFHQLVSLGALEDAADLFSEGLQGYLERAGQFEDAMACLDLLLADQDRLDEALDDGDVRYLLRLGQAGLAVRLGLPDVTLRHTDAELGHPSWRDEPEPEAEFVGRLVGRALLAQVRATALWFLGRTSEAKRLLTQTIDSVQDDEDVRSLLSTLLPQLAMIQLVDGEIVAYRESTRAAIDVMRQAIDEALADVDEDEPPAELVAVQRMIDLQEQALDVLPDRNLADFSPEDRGKLGDLLALMRVLFEEQVLNPQLAPDVRQTFELQIAVMRLSELQLGTTISSDELMFVEEQFRRLLASARHSNLVLQEVNALVALSAVLSERGNLRQATERAEEAIAISDARAFRPGSVSGRVQLAQLAVRQRDDAAAELWEADARRLAMDDGEEHYGMVFDGLQRVKTEMRTKV
jgi:tetratricopeptide (TPR) repeat protein